MSINIIKTKDNMKYYGLYKITNLVNGKMYIGQHVTSNLDDGYMGGGKIVNKAVKKYGKENFRKEWLGFYEDQDELDYMERVFVDQTWVDKADTYNLILGGQSVGRYMSKLVKEKISKSLRGKKHSDIHNKHVSEALIDHVVSEATRNKISESCKGHMAVNARAVLQYSKDGELVAEYKSLHEAAKASGGSAQNIYHACRGHYKSSCGFIWKYKEH